MSLLERMEAAGWKVHKFAVGDMAWFYCGRGEDNEPVQGKVIAVVSLPGYEWPHYIIAEEHAMGENHYVRDWMSMQSENPEAESTD